MDWAHYLGNERMWSVEQHPGWCSELKDPLGGRVMVLLRKLACLLIGHSPVVVRRGNDSILACERCHRFFEMFVTGLYAGKR